MEQDKVAADVTAAGLGKRMNQPDLPKVLTKLDGKPLYRACLTVSRRY